MLDSRLLPSEMVPAPDISETFTIFTLIFCCYFHFMGSGQNIWSLLQTVKKVLTKVNGLRTGYSSWAGQCSPSQSDGTNISSCHY